MYYIVFIELNKESRIKETEGLNRCGNIKLLSEVDIKDNIAYEGRYSIISFIFYKIKAFIV